MRAWIRIPRIQFYSHHPLPLSLTSPFCSIIFSSPSPPPSLQKDWSQLHRECSEFLPWLRQKTGTEISSVLSVGFSSHGRSLFASKSIKAGDCILKIPYDAQITTANIRPEIESLLVDDVDNISRLAVVLLTEQKLGQDSEWEPYISSLPCIKEMHNMMFWSKQELHMIQASSIYQDIIDQKSHLEKEFLALKPALQRFPQLFGDLMLENFLHAYALIISRAWRASKGISLIPFADFHNHDGASKAMLLSDDVKEISEVIADRDYAIGEQVLIRYGKFCNATLMLDFGFTLPYNIHDQVQIWMDIAKHDPLYSLKSELLHEHCFPKKNALKSSKSSFIIREVKSPTGKGKGIPQALRAYARVLSITTHEGLTCSSCSSQFILTHEELKALQMETAENDGRLARRSLKNKRSEIQAHQNLLSQLTQMFQDLDSAVKVLESINSNENSSQLNARRKMAIDLLHGELRVLKSACAWLTNYCADVPLGSTDAKV